MRRQFATTFAAAVAALTVAAAPVLAGGNHGKEKKAEKSTEVKRMHSATETLNEVLQMPDKGIPQNMIENAAGVAVIPGVVKAGFVAGARHGNGVMSVRSDGAWSNPVFVGLSGGSIGWQAGVKSTDIVLVFMDPQAIDDFMNGEVTLGGNVSAAVGPVGRTGGASASTDLDAQVYAYARSKGAFAGLSIDGTSLYIDDDANRNFYGKNATAANIVHGRNVEQRDATSDFVMALKRNGNKEGS